MIMQGNRQVPYTPVVWAVQAVTIVRHILNAGFKPAVAIAWSVIDRAVRGVFPGVPLHFGLIGKIGTIRTCGIFVSLWPQNSTLSQ